MKSHAFTLSWELENDQIIPREISCFHVLRLAVNYQIRACEISCIQPCTPLWMAFPSKPHDPCDISCFYSFVGFFPPATRPRESSCWHAPATTVDKQIIPRLLLAALVHPWGGAGSATSAGYCTLGWSIY